MTPPPIYPSPKKKTNYRCDYILKQWQTETCDEFHCRNKRPYKIYVDFFPGFVSLFTFGLSCFASWYTILIREQFSNSFFFHKLHWNLLFCDLWYHGIVNKIQGMGKNSRDGDCFNGIPMPQESYISRLGTCVLSVNEMRAMFGNKVDLQTVTIPRIWRKLFQEATHHFLHGINNARASLCLYIQIFEIISSFIWLHLYWFL